MQICDEASRCAFYAQFVDAAGFREEHFHYFCFGPLSENCARRVYARARGHSPRQDYSPIGTYFSP